MTEPSHLIFARLYDPVMKPAERTVLAEHRRYLVDEISGTVLDLGAGDRGDVSVLRRSYC